MKILQAGVEKSGNYWLYQILNKSAIHAGVERKSYIQNSEAYHRLKNIKLSYEGQAAIDTVEVSSGNLNVIITSLYREKVSNISEYSEQISHVWTHSTCSPIIEELMMNIDKTVCIIRDPRDVLISKSKFAFSEYSLQYRNSHPGESPDDFINKRLIGSTLRWSLHLLSYLEASKRFPIYFVFYENLLNDFESEYRKILDFLGLELSREYIEQITHEVDYSFLKKKDPNHVRKGRSNQWVDILSEKQNQLILNICQPILDHFKYPIIHRDVIDCNGPRFSEATDDQLRFFKKSVKGGFKDKILYAINFFESNRSIRSIVKKGFQFITNRY